MTSDLYEFIKRHGAERYPEEACGVVIRRGHKFLPIACRNTAAEPCRHFVISPEDYARAADEGEVVGVWHTHPELSPEPSDADRVGCENIELPWFIVGVYKADDGFAFSDMVTVEPSGFELPYLERPYAFGVLDCWSLVRDWYRREFDIRLGDYPRIEEFWKKTNYFGENWQAEGFVRLVDEEPKTGDIFLIQTDNTGNPNHIAIYIGNETILHHCHGRLSRREPYGGYWQKHTSHHLRHKSKC